MDDGLRGGMAARMTREAKRRVKTGRGVIIVGACIMERKRLR